MDYNITKEDIIRMAIESELIYNEEGWCGWVEDTDLRPFIERFAALVRADERSVEREACAKVCESEEDMFKSCAYGANDGRYDWKEDAARECAATIRERSANERARGETK